MSSKSGSAIESAKTWSETAHDRLNRLIFGNYAEAEHPLSYGLAHFAVSTYERHAHKMQVLGKEQLLNLGGAVILIPHRDAYDSIGAGVAIDRPVHYMAKQEMWEDNYAFEIPILHKKSTAGRIAEHFGAFPVDKRRPGHSSIKKAIDIARAGKLVGMYPEMTRFIDEELKIVRGPELGDLHPGAAMIADKAGVPLVPMGLKVQKETNAKGKSKVTGIAAVIKEPMQVVLDPSLSRAEAYEQIMEEEVRPVLQEAFDEACELAA